MLALASCGRLGFDAHDAGAGDAPSTIDAHAAATCNAITRVADDFSTDRRTTLWSAYADGTTQANVVNNALVFDLEANAVKTFVGFQTGHLYDLRGRRTWVGLADPASGSAASSGLGI